MSWTVTIGGQTFTNANVDGTAYADEVTGFPAIIAAMATEAAFLKGVGNTSTTSLTPGSGTKTLTLNQTPGFSVGMLAAAQSVSDPSHYMVGSVAAINGSDIDITVTIASGGTAKSDWVVTYPVPGTITDANGDLAISTGSIWTTASDADWNAGGNRALLDFLAGEARVGGAAGGGGATSLGLYVDAARYLQFTGGWMVAEKPFAVSKSSVQARATIKQWLDDTENLSVGGTIDDGWSQVLVTAASDTATAPNGDTVAETVTASGGSGSHRLEVRRGTLDTTYADIYTLSVYVKAKDTNYFGLTLQSDTTADGANARFDLATLSVYSSSVVNQGILLATAITDAGDGWYRCSITVDMSDGTGNSIFGQFFVYGVGGAEGYIPATTPESLYMWGAQLNGGALADYVPNNATSGQSHGFSIGAEHHDVGTHTLAADTIINLEPAASAEQRVVKIDLIQDGTAGWDLTVYYDYSTTNLIEMNTKPVFTSQAPAQKTRLIAEITSFEARVWYEEHP